jgi:hypothetical protein
MNASVQAWKKDSAVTANGAKISQVATSNKTGPVHARLKQKWVK